MGPHIDAIRAIAFYLPQFHPIPENDEWWGRGFTEWTNTARAKPMFRGHYQPHIPADLGFYDLRVPETRQLQADMAKEYGISAFCYYHYWFDGKRLLEKPFDEVLNTGMPEFPFCLCWANQSWTGIWHGAPNRILIEQTYPGLDDHREHFAYFMKAFRDRRYVTVDGRPLLLIYNPSEIPQVEEVMGLWREMADESGLDGLYLVGYSWDGSWDPEAHGFDASIAEGLPGRRRSLRKSPVRGLLSRIEMKRGKPVIYQYEEMLGSLAPRKIAGRMTFPVAIPNWDNTPRSGSNGLVLHGSTPELFRRHLRDALMAAREMPVGRRIVFVKSWNEWAEGNHLEPDLRFGRGYLEVIREELREEARPPDLLGDGDA